MDLISPSKDKNLLTNWIKRKGPTICCLQETHLMDRNKQWLWVKGWKIYQANGPPKQAGVAILISGKVNFKPTLIEQDRRTFHTNQKGNTPTGNNSYQPICTQFHQLYSEGTKNIYRLQHSGSGKL
jgi:exonuclease III